MNKWLKIDFANKRYMHKPEALLKNKMYKIFWDTNRSPNPDQKISLVSLFNGISTLFRLFNAKAILLEEQ